MTEVQRQILQADQRRHLALAKACTEVSLREHHEAIAEALGAAVAEGEVKQCRLVISSVLSLPDSPRSLRNPRCRARKTRRRGK